MPWLCVLGRRYFLNLEGVAAIKLTKPWNRPSAAIWPLNPFRHGAGHMSPQWRPEAVYRMVQNFLG